MQNQQEGGQMNRRLAGAILAAFRNEPTETLRERFSPFDEREWLRSREWLHTSGLALYFLGRARALGIEDVMPAQVLHGLERSQRKSLQVRVGQLRSLKLHIDSHELPEQIIRCEPGSQPGSTPGRAALA